MTTATNTERTTFTGPEGYELVVVQEHNRALPGEAGNSYKPVLVREHLRRIDHTGKERSYRTNYQWKTGELSEALVHAMAKVQEVPRSQLPTKGHPWTLREATYVLTYDMRYDRKRSLWHRGSFTWGKSAEECMAAIDRKVAKGLIQAAK